MEAQKIDVHSLAQSNLDAALDAPVNVITATIPLQVSEFIESLAGMRSFQVVVTDAGLFLIGWKFDGSFEILDLNRTPVPVAVPGAIPTPRDL